MWRKLATFTASLCAAAIAGSSMSAGAAPLKKQCRVVAAAKLPAQAGGAASICSEIEQAMGAAVPNARYEVEVRVVTPARLSARMIVEGRQLPELNLASSDRELTAGAIRRFARSLGEAAKAARSES
jgi:hypothetical protein